QGNKRYSGVYVLELNYLAGPERFKRIQIDSVDQENYYCTFTDLYDAKGDPIRSNPVTTVIPKNESANFTYISFKNGFHLVLGQEPHKDQWDFVFTRYNHFFDNVIPNE